MSNFLTSIHINKIFHLENIDIPIDKNEKKHLIITGKNGSGKTSLLIALIDFFQQIRNEKQLNLLELDKEISFARRIFDEIKNKNIPKNLPQETIFAVSNWKKRILQKLKKIDPEFSNLTELFFNIQNGDFVVAYYAANRKTEVMIPKSPEKPNLKPLSDLKKSMQGEFVRFLVDLKTQGMFANQENDKENANKIKKWFDDFEKLLSEIFEGSEVSLVFNYKDYSFTIKQDGREFGFNQLSDGYSAIIDIIADLILKMQTPESLTRAYEKEGIVLIDEIETHLHLELQRLILPMLTRVFPNIQFIVTTHSPFVLSSIKNAVAFDLEKKERLEDLTEYSYEALAEGYFEVKTESNFLQAKLDRYKELAQKSHRDTAENIELEELDKEFYELNESLAPQNVIGSYRQIKLTSK
jgi:predicted ATP-binding protein involved in virulence